MGDLSGKYGTFLNLSSYTGIHVDYNLPLFGKNSIQGRSIVIHKMKTMGSKRWVCADVFQVADGDNMFIMKTMINFTGPAIKGYVLLVSYLQYTAEPLHRDVEVFTLPQRAHISLNQIVCSTTAVFCHNDSRTNFRGL